MAKGPTLTDLTGQYAAQTTINNNYTEIEDAFDNTISRDGSSPNQMQADFDMNSNDILNVNSIDVQTLTIDGEAFSSTGTVDTSSAQTLTNKTMDADNNTFTNFKHGEEVDDPSSGVHGVLGDVVGTSDAQALFNKSINGNNNTITNLAHGAEVDDPSSGVHGVTGDVVGTSDTQTLTNKTIDYNSNTITNLPSSGTVDVNYASRSALVSAWTNGDKADGTILSDGDVLYEAEQDATVISDLTGLVPFGQVTVKHWGAVGDWDGSTGTDDMSAIDEALTWWKSGEARCLHIPQGWYFYDGAADLDFSGYRFNKMTCDGVVWFGTSNSVGWDIYNFEDMTFNVNMRGGGSYGDFSTSTPTGGTIALRFAQCRWLYGRIEAMNYKGRVVHYTANGTGSSNRCRVVDMTIITGNRNDADDDPTGQPFFADSGSSSQTGAFGSIKWWGGGQQYGPVMERLNDIHIPWWEGGPFSNGAPEFRGCQVVHADNLYIGESDSTGGASAPGLSFVNTSSGRKCADITLNKVRTTRCSDGLYADDFDTSVPGLRIGTLIAGDGDGYALNVNDMHDVTVASLGTKGNSGALQVTGACGHVDVSIDDIGTVSGDVVDIQGTVEHAKISGNIKGGASGFSLIKLGANNNLVELQNLGLESSVCDELINSAYSGTNKVRHVGGYVELGGSTTIYNGAYRPSVIHAVEGYATDTYFYEGNIVDTVSGSAASPTGAIMDEGSDANGYWAKYANGVMECWTNSFDVDYSSSAQCASNWNFPGPGFSETPAVHGTINITTTTTSATPGLDMLLPPVWGNSGDNDDIAQISVFRINGGTNFQSGDYVRVMLRAIGRWD